MFLNLAVLERFFKLIFLFKIIKEEITMGEFIKREVDGQETVGVLLW